MSTEADRSHLPPPGIPPYPAVPPLAAGVPAAGVSAAGAPAAFPGVPPAPEGRERSTLRRAPLRSARPPLPPLPPSRGGPNGPPGGAELRARSRPAGPAARRTAAAAVCLVLGLGLLSGAVAGTWLTGGPPEPPAAERAWTQARSLWHSLPVDELFPPTLRGDGAGPGGSDRRWTRIAVAPDSSCRDAFDPELASVLSPVGCHRLVRATYVDETTSSMTTVGLLFTEAGPADMTALRKRFETEGLKRDADAMPRPYAAGGTVAAGFGNAQRASWTIRVLTDAPVVVYAVSAFVDGRAVADPQPADEAMAEGQTTAPAQAGLGHAAEGIADRVERDLRARVAEMREAVA